MFGCGEDGGEVWDVELLMGGRGEGRGEEEEEAADGANGERVMSLCRTYVHIVRYSTCDGSPRNVGRTYVWQ